MADREIKESNQIINLGTTKQVQWTEQSPKEIRRNNRENARKICFTLVRIQNGQIRVIQHVTAWTRMEYVMSSWNPGILDDVRIIWNEL